MKCFLEVCVDNIESARNAEAGGADRIELCQALEVGGLTPSLGLMRKVKECLDIPIFAMIRPRAGNFCYSTLEVDQMKYDIMAALSVGINGFVFGALRKNVVDKEICLSLLNECRSFPVTFHRAFDLIENTAEALSDIIDLGFSRILTSGQSESAFTGMENIKCLIEKASSRIIIMPGCGLNVTNLKDIKEYTHAKEFHSSAQLPHSAVQHDNIVKGTTYYTMTSTDVVKKLKAILHNVS